MKAAAKENATPLEAPAFKTRGAFRVAGLSDNYIGGKMEGIPAQWQRFVPYLGKIPRQVGRTAYGVCYNFDHDMNMDYLCCVEVFEDASLPEGLTSLQIDGQEYVVFTHRGHISGIGETWHRIFSEGLAAAECALVNAPSFELYNENFDRVNKTGSVEIWVPVTR